MWFNILKEDNKEADDVWDNRTRQYFIKVLEEMFDKVDANFDKVDGYPEFFDRPRVHIWHEYDWGEIEIVITKTDINSESEYHQATFRYSHDGYNTELIDKIKLLHRGFSTISVADWKKTNFISEALRLN